MSTKSDLQSAKSEIANLQLDRKYTNTLHDDLVKRHGILGDKVERLVDVLIASGILVEVEQGGVVSKSNPVFLGVDHYGPVYRSSEKHYVVATTKTKAGK